MKYYRINNVLAQIPEVEHDEVMNQLINNALELSWADYCWFVKQKKLKLKSSQFEQEYYHRRTDKEIKKFSNITATVSEIQNRLERERKYAIKHNRLHPEKAINRRILQKLLKTVDNSLYHK